MLDSDLLTSPLEQVLLDLGTQGSTGVLMVTDDGGEVAEVYLRDGLVYSVFVPGRRPLLGARLMSSGSLAPETLAEALEIQRTELQGWRLGELLVYLGFVERSVVEAFVSEQLVDMMLDLMRWSVSTWKFRKNKKARQDVAPPQTVAELFAKLSTRTQDWVRLRNVVGGPGSLPRLSSSGSTNDDVVLGPGEWAMLCKVDGERTLAELASDCGFTVYEAAQVIEALVNAGLVDVEGELEDDPAGDPSISAPTLDDRAWEADEEPTTEQVANSVARVTAALEGMLAPLRSRLVPDARQVEEDEIRRRRDAEAIAAEVEAARQRELKRSRRRRRPSGTSCAELTRTRPGTTTSHGWPRCVPRSRRRHGVSTSSGSRISVPAPRRRPGLTTRSGWRRRPRPSASKRSMRKLAESSLPERRRSVSKQSGPKPSAWKPSALRPSASRRSGLRPSGPKPSGSKQSASKPSALRPSGPKPSGSKQSGWKPSGLRPSGSKPSGWRPSGLKPSGSKPSASKPSGRSRAARSRAPRSRAREAERLEAERLEAERAEAERLEAERAEAERLEAERLEAERLRPSG